MALKIDSIEYAKLIEIGRPPNIKKLFPNSKALLVSGKVIDRALRAKGQAMTIAANGRNHLIIRGALMAAQKAKAAIIIEIAKSEGGRKAYCATNYWNLASQVDALANELGVTVPVAIHADHYALKSKEDLQIAYTEVPSMFEAGITSIAIDASHLHDDDNLLMSIAINNKIPVWAGLECEVGEIKGTIGLSTAEEALFLVQGLNAHSIFPDWIALNNGTVHGIEDTSAGIQIELTAAIHKALKPYNMSGAQHGTSGNSYERLQAIATETLTTKANVATALQMVSWGVKIDEYGNAVLDEKGNLIKVEGRGLSEELWAEMVAEATKNNYSAGDYKNFNLSYENKIMAQNIEIRERMATDVEKFVYHLLVNVFNAENTASLAYEVIQKAGTYDLGPKSQKTEDLAQWTEEKIKAKGKLINPTEGAAGNFDD